ncbi:MAG: BT_3928 family protein [Sphingomonadales bacterium]
MKVVLLLVRWAVGLLFIFSGLVKANDPLGLSYKMQEFFEVWKWHGFEPYTLTASIVLNSVEIIAGVALLMGWALRYINWLLLALILLFTVLTGYTFFTGMPKNCGCFGDCLPISSGVSFGKDVVLTVLIGFLLLNASKTDSFVFSFRQRLPILLSTFFAFGFQLYALRYLPLVDCLPYKEMASIPEAMKIPSNAIADSFVIEFTYRKNGREIRFPAIDFPADFSAAYEFVGREDRLIRKGSNNEAPIKGFALQGISGADSTDAILNTGPAIWIWAASMRSFDRWKASFLALEKEARKKNLPVLLITAQPNEAALRLSVLTLTDLPVFSCDLKAIQTAARVEPTIMLVDRGTIRKKRSIGCALSVIE